MGRNDKFSRIKAKRITPIVGMRMFLGDSTFMVVMLVSALFSFLHQRAINTEMNAGGGGFWCVLGMPALLCLVISTVLTYFGARTKLMPAMVPVLGLGGIAASIAMFFIIVIRRMFSAGDALGILQELSMLAFLAAWFVCVLLLMLTGIGMKVIPSAGIAAMAATVTALVLFVVRAMYVFSSLITALSRNLLLPDGEMAKEIRWVLRSVMPGGEESRALYFDRILDSVGIVLLMMCCIPLALKFNGFFSEQSAMLRSARDIPLPTEYRRVYTGYDEYTEDVPVTAKTEEEFTITSDGYYVEKTVTSRPKFKKRERAEIPDEPETTEVPTVEQDTVETEGSEVEEIIEYASEYYDDYVPGEGWGRFLERSAPQEADRTDERSESAERKRVKAVPTSKPAIDPNDPDFWNQYSN
ncbi:MAG: hypothetical protein E7554_03610 [Ruminococcaceae bacterium]|nr:hypothetical protein [Oscillospiraceae bacterium]